MLVDCNRPTPTAAEIGAAAEAAVQAIPPAWPLASSVAVNPYLGQIDRGLPETAALLGRVAGVRVTMSRAWYRDRIAKGVIADVDLDEALQNCPTAWRPPSVMALRWAAEEPCVDPVPEPTVADLAADHAGIDWSSVIADRLGAWAGGYFDEGQALWAAARDKGAYAAWRAFATHDLTPEIVGLHKFAAFVADAPESASEAIERATRRLGMTERALATYFHRLLISMGGWAQIARFHRWQADLAGRNDPIVTDLLAIRLLWEEALLTHYAGSITADWVSAESRYAQPVEPTPGQIVDTLLQDAYERAAQRRLAATLAAPANETPPAPVLQAAFCIDVRSEVFRRALESVDPRIQTLGFAGFFGLTASHRRFGSDVAEHRLPVLLNPGFSSRAGGEAEQRADRTHRHRARATRAWGRFQHAAVSSFAFVEAAGPAYIVKLVRDALGLHANPLPNDPAPRPDPDIGQPSRVGMASSILRAMSLTRGFAPLVLLVGHGANVSNNPHASALHCGACGGYSGEVNARLLAGLLNDPAVRSGLEALGIFIPKDTVFLGALHDTTTDKVMLYPQDCAAPHRSAEIATAEAWLAAAGVIARTERAVRLPRATSAADVTRRSRDWAETRPEWAFANCNAFIAAPRRRTIGKALNGRAFLHDYDWRQDGGFGVLELIMTAPVVVASWISLQYYGSTVAPVLFGGGNKLLHNVTGGVGVVEGNGGLLRVGLPWQSVHDGNDFIHDPLRLSVCIEAPTFAMSDILARHPGVRALFDNRWLHLFALDGSGRISSRYDPKLGWVPAVGAPASDCATELAA
ncbi:MAG: DUF2309 domain-containing protein [Sphingobium sp.]|nr:DUF2309 domain-containing protein [Sphingobium sp.]